MGKIISYGIIILLSIFVIYQIIKERKKEGDRTNAFKLAVPSIIAIAALLFPLLSNGETLSVVYPNVEKYIENNKKLATENHDLKGILARREKEKDELSKKNDSLNKKNFAEIKQIEITKDGLKLPNVDGVVASVNGENYFNESTLNSLSEKEMKYNDNNKTLYIGKESDKVEKVRLEDVTNILYSGDNYQIVGLENSDMDNFKVAGKEIDSGFVLGMSEYQEKGSFVLINLDEDYSNIEFDLGRVDADSDSIDDGNLKLIGDEKIRAQEKINAEETSRHYSFGVRGVKSLKIGIYGSASEYGFYNLILTKK